MPNDSPYGTAPAPQPPQPPRPPSVPDPGPGQPVAPPRSNGSGAPSPEGPAAPAGLSSADLERALSPLQSELAALRQENAALREGLQTSQAPPGGLEGDDFGRSFFDDPKAAVTGVVKEIVGSLAPYLRELSGVAQDGILAGHQANIDAEFGPGTFQEEIAPVLTKRFEQVAQQDPALLANRGWINSEIAAIKGFKMDTLFDRKSKAAEARTTAEKQEAERLMSHLGTYNLTGGLRPGLEGRTREPTEAEKEYLDLRARAGTPRALEELRVAQSSGNTLKEMREAFKPSKSEGQ